MVCFWKIEVLSYYFLGILILFSPFKVTSARYDPNRSWDRSLRWPSYYAYYRYPIYGSSYYYSYPLNSTYYHSYPSYYVGYSYPSYPYNGYHYINDHRIPSNRFYSSYPSYKRSYSYERNDTSDSNRSYNIKNRVGIFIRE